MIDAGIFPFTQAQVYVQAFGLGAFVYIYFTFASLEVVVELCTLLRYEVIVWKCEGKEFRFRLIFVRHFVCPS